MFVSVLLFELTMEKEGAAGEKVTVNSLWDRVAEYAQRQSSAAHWVLPIQALEYHPFLSAHPP